MANVVIDIAAEFTGKKAFKQADTATDKLSKGAKKLGAALGVAFSARAIVAYGKASVEAFAADDKAAKTLSKTLSNLGLAFADPEIKTFISTLERQSGVLDDALRPAYQKLVTTTGDYKRSQDLLQTALDLSAQSGVDLLTVSGDLGKAFVGNTRGLVKYNLGLNKTQLAAMSFEEILLRITKISQGQAALAADTYAGKLDKLTVASENAKEVLGGALLDSLIKLGGGDVDKATEKIDKLSTSLATLIRLATGTSEMSVGEILQGVDYKFGIIPTDRKISTNRSKSPAGTAMRNQASIKAAANAKKLAEDQAKSQKALTKAQQDALKLAKAKAVFDLQKIQIEAALKGKLSEEDRIRLKLLQAIEKENLSDVEKYQEKLKEAQEKAKELQAILDKMKDVEVKDPFSTWKVDPLTTAIGGLTTALTDVRTGMTSTGIAWSDVAAKIAATEVKPNLTQWSSTFKMATDEAESAVETAVTALGSTTAAATAAAIAAAAAATATANAALISTSSASAQAAADAADLLSASNNAALTSTTEAATKAAIDAAAAAVAAANAALTATSSTATEAIGTSTTTATNTTVLAIAESGTATAGTIIETSQAAADALDLLYSNATNALTSATTATTTDFMATSSAALESLKDILSAQANEYAAAAAAASAQAAADAADLGGAGNAGGGINITVQTGIGDPNAIAEAISEVLREAGTRGTIGVLGID